ncbi:hypothetical protein QBD01_003412 [Ochrobactrum sp. 19YEA23]|nr:hypothetical protein [Ochrobactrum sp. 19YEA23]
MWMKLSNSPDIHPGFQSKIIVCTLEHFQQKCVAVMRRIMRKNKKLERFHDSDLTGTALNADDAKRTSRAMTGWLDLMTMH